MCGYGAGRIGPPRNRKLRVYDGSEMFTLPSLSQPKKRNSIVAVLPGARLAYFGPACVLHSPSTHLCAQDDTERAGSRCNLAHSDFLGDQLRASRSHGAGSAGGGGGGGGGGAGAVSSPPVSSPPVSSPPVLTSISRLGSHGRATELLGAARAAGSTNASGARGCGADREKCEGEGSSASSRHARVVARRRDATG